MNRTNNNRSFRTGLRLVQLLAGILLVALSSQTYAAVEKKVFYHNNLLGSPVAATDESGNLCWREDYRPYGEKIRNEDQGCGLDGNEVGFTGHVHDRDIGLTYMQARYYDPVVGRFMGVDPVGFEENNPMLFNRYAYANNNPYNYIDKNGKWASKWGAYVHQRATYLVIGKGLPRSDNRVLAEGQVYADSGQFQGPESAYRHAMRAPWESVGEARRKANDFVRSQFDKAFKAKGKEERLKAFSVALHALQDSTSPEHKGFQVWSGEETKVEEMSHVLGEFITPSQSSDLFKITRKAWEWFLSGQLPEGDLFAIDNDRGGSPNDYAGDEDVLP